MQHATLGYDVDKIVFVGGSTQIPYFKDICRGVFVENIIICDTLNPEHTISIGAAYQAASLQGETTLLEDNVLLDVLNMTVGVEVDGGIMVPIVSKNTHLPTTRTKCFTNSEDKTSELTINVFQGERKLVRDNVLIGSFVLSGLDTTLKQGEMNIRVKFDIDQNGIMQVSAYDSKTDNSSNIQITNVERRDSHDNEDYVIEDSIMANKILAKMELQESVKFRMKMIRRESAVGQKWTNELLELFDYTDNIIKTFDMYDNEFLRQTRVNFEDLFHQYFRNQRVL